MSGLLLGQPNAVTPIDTFNEGRNNALLGRAFSAAPDARNGLIGDVAMTDPRQALAFQGALQAQDESTEDRKQKALVNMARFYTSAPEQARPGLRAQLAPALAKFGIDATSVSPEDFDKTAQAIVDAWTPGNQTPTGFREADMKAQAAGYKRGSPEYQNAMRVDLGTVGRASNAGYGFEMIEGRNGEKTLQRRNPRTGAVEQYDPQTGEFAPVGISTSAAVPTGRVDPTIVGTIQEQPTVAAAARGSQPDPSPVEDANRWLAAGVPEQEIGARLSAKYGGQLGGSMYPSVIIRNGQASAGTTGGQPERQPASPDLVTSRAPEVTAGAVQNAKNEADIATLPRKLQIENDAAVDAAGRKVTAEGDAHRGLDQPQARASLSDATGNLDRLADTARRIMQHPGLRGITSWQSKIPDIPGSDAANAHAELEALKSQVGFGVLQAMRNASKTGGALGSVSDNEQALLQSNLAALQQSQSPEAFRQNLQRIIDYTTQAKSRLNGAFQQTYQSGERIQPSATSSQNSAHAPVDDLLSKYGVR